MDDAIGLDEAEEIGMQRLLRELRVSCRARMRKVLETVVEAIGLAEKLIQGAGAEDILNVCEK